MFFPCIGFSHQTCISTHGLFNLISYNLGVTIEEANEMTDVQLSDLMNTTFGNMPKDELELQNQQLKELLDNYNIKKDKIDAILVTSQLCPETYGDAVYWARAIVDDIEGLEGDYNDGCLASRSNNNETSNINNNIHSLIQVVPNPNRGLFKIQLDEAIAVERVEIFDLNGLKVWSQNKINQHKYIDIRLANGIYILNIMDTTGTKYTQKIVILNK